MHASRFSRLPVVLAGALIFSAAGVAQGQSTISATDHYAYSANAGWIDWRPTSADGVRMTDTYLTGYAYGANIGWISLGPGTPSNGYRWVNNASTNYGVNVAADGTLDGYAYSANAGWIQFGKGNGGAAKVNLLTGQMSGYAYGANLGWIALQTPLTNLATTTISRPDTDGDGIADPWEYQYFDNLTTATATSDYDGDGQPDLAEYTAGTNPKDATSKLSIVAHSWTFTSGTVTFTSVPTRQYTVETSSTLNGSDWSATAAFPGSSSGGTTVRSINGLPSAPSRFLRVSVAPGLP